jgi:hypothetical protein
MRKDERNFKPAQAAQRHYIQLYDAKITQDQLTSPTPHQAPQRRAAHTQNQQCELVDFTLFLCCRQASVDVADVMETLKHIACKRAGDSSCSEQVS